MTRRVNRGASQTGLSDLFLGAWKPASNAGSHISTATTAAGCLAETRTNPAKIGGLLHVISHIFIVALLPLRVLGDSCATLESRKRCH